MATPVPVFVPAKIINGKKTFTVLENNPDVLTKLAHTLGLSTTLSFTDIYSLSEPALLSLIPRPVLGLVVIIPISPIWKADRQAEDASFLENLTRRESNRNAGALTEEDGEEKKVLWFRQTIGNACGSYALIHTLINGPAKEYITAGSTLARLRDEAAKWENSDVDERAKILYDSKELEVAHQEAAQLGDSVAPNVEDHVGGHFVAFVKEGGRLWELEGNRKGPLERGLLADGEDVLSEGAIERGIGRILKLERDGGGEDLRFSIVALVENKQNEE